MLDSPLLTGSRVRLAAPLDGDVTAIAAWHQDESFLRLARYGEAVPESEDAVRAWYLSPGPADLVFAVRTVAEDALAGYLRLEVLSWPHRNAAAFVGIDPAAWGRGYGTEALWLALGFAYREMNLHRVQVTAFRYNERAVAMFNKVGFTVDGTLRDYVRRDGKWYDLLVMSMLGREWRSGGRAAEG